MASVSVNTVMVLYMVHYQTYTCFCSTHSPYQTKPVTHSSLPQQSQYINNPVPPSHHSPHTTYTPTTSTHSRYRLNIHTHSPTQPYDILPKHGHSPNIHVIPLHSHTSSSSIPPQPTYSPNIHIPFHYTTTHLAQTSPPPLHSSPI